MIRIAAIAAAGAAVLGLTYLAMKPPSAADDIFADCRQSSVGGADIGGPFSLISETGEAVTEKDVITGPTLIYFGYAFCPDVCPLDNARNAEAISILDERGVEVTPVFISVDPDRDTPELLDDFTANMHPRMIGLTGTHEQVAAASKAYKTYYKRVEGEDDDYYLIDHSTFSYLVFPEHGFVEFFRRDVTPEDMANRLQCFVQAAEG